MGGVLGGGIRGWRTGLEIDLEKESFEGKKTVSLIG